MTARKLHEVRMLFYSKSLPYLLDRLFVLPECLDTDRVPKQKNFVDPQSSFRRLHQIVFEERTVNIISNIQAPTKCFSLVW